MSYKLIGQQFGTGQWAVAVVRAKVEALIGRINNKLNKLIHLNCHHHFEQLSAIRRLTTLSTLTKNFWHYPTLRPSTGLGAKLGSRATGQPNRQAGWLAGWLVAWKSHF